MSLMNELLLRKEYQLYSLKKTQKPTPTDPESQHSVVWLWQGMSRTRWLKNGRGRLVLSIPIWYRYFLSVNLIWDRRSQMWRGRGLRIPRSLTRKHMFSHVASVNNIYTCTLLWMSFVHHNTHNVSRSTLQNRVTEMRAGINVSDCRYDAVSQSHKRK